MAYVATAGKPHQHKYIGSYITFHSSSTTLRFLTSKYLTDRRNRTIPPLSAKYHKDRITLMALPVTGGLISNWSVANQSSAFIAKGVYLHRTMGFPESVSGLWTSTCGAYFSPFAHATWFAIGLGSLFSLGRQVPPKFMLYSQTALLVTLLNFLVHA